MIEISNSRPHATKPRRFTNAATLWMPLLRQPHDRLALRAVSMGFQRHFLVFDRTPQPFEENIVHETTASRRRNRDACSLEPSGQRRIRARQSALSRCTSLRANVALRSLARYGEKFSRLSHGGRRTHCTRCERASLFTGEPRCCGRGDICLHRVFPCRSGAGGLPFRRRECGREYRERARVAAMPDRIC